MKHLWEVINGTIFPLPIIFSQSTESINTYNIGEKGATVSKLDVGLTKGATGITPQGNQSMSITPHSNGVAGTTVKFVFTGSGANFFPIGAFGALLNLRNNSVTFFIMLCNLF